jgi:hypothetical protein
MVPDDRMNYRWDPAKDEWLQRNRGFGFDDIVEAIRANRLIAAIANPSARFPHQRMFIVELDGYAVGVPYVEEGGTAFLKTAFRSRKLKRLFMEH